MKVLVSLFAVIFLVSSAFGAEIPRVVAIPVVADAPRVVALPIVADAPRVVALPVVADAPRVVALREVAEIPRVVALPVAADASRVVALPEVAEIPRVVALPVVADASRVAALPDRSAIDNLISVLESLAQSTDDVIQSFNSLLLGATEAATDALEKSIQELRDLVNLTAQQTGDTESTCVQEQLTAAEEVLDDTYHGTVTCFTRRVEELTEYLSELSSINMEAVALLAEAREGSKECRQKPFLSQSVCLTQLTTRLAARQTILAARAAIVIARITSLGDTLQTCVIVNVGVATVRISVIVGRITACAISG